MRNLLQKALACAQALNDRHDAGEVHGYLTVADFRVSADGSATLIPPSKSNVFSLDLLFYASPEQAGRLNALDRRSDLYSLGVVFYEMFVGQVPFEGADVLKLIHCHMAVRPIPPIERVPHLPRVVSEIIMKLLEKSPEARYASCVGLIDNLRTCLATLTPSGDIPPFDIGRVDRASQFVIPDRLYGRQHEIAILDETFNRAMRGEIVLCLVGGYSGIGKSTLVRRMRDHIVSSGGILVEGKFDQYHRETPYSALLEAFRSIVQHILGGSRDDVAAWAARVDAALDENASVIIDVLPEIEFLIGPKPKAPELGDAASRERFNTLFTRLLLIFASKEHPLVMFLDDLQWVDIASLALLRSFIAHAKGAHLLVVGAYRDNEVNSGHPLVQMLDGLRREGAPIYELSLGPLSLADLTEMITDTCVNLSEPEALAKLVMQKTGGNPFFSRQFLRTMYIDKLLYFDLAQNGWRCKPTARLENSTTNVVDLMMARLSKQSDEARVALKVAACIGKKFDVPLLAMVMQVDEPRALTLLAGALHDELLLPTAAEGSAILTFSFAHDRVQQAAYQQKVGPRHAEVHLAIGRALWTGSLESLPQHAIFAIADQINLAVDLIAETDELLRIAELNMVAARRARASLAYTAAANYLEAGVRCLPFDRRWSHHYPTAYGLYLASAEIYSLLNSEPEFQGVMAVLLDKVTSQEDRLDVRICQTAHYCLSSRMLEGLELGCLGLAEIGVVVPPLTDKPALESAFADQLAKFRATTEGLNLETFLFELPRVNDRLSESMLRLIGAMGDAATILNTPLLSLLAVIGAQRSIAYGNTPLSPLMYSLLGQGMIASERRYREGRKLADTALRLMEERQLDLWSYGRARVHQFWFILHWSQDHARLLGPIEEALQVTKRAHDPLYAGYLLNVAVIIRYFRGASMDEVLTAHERVIEHCRPYSMNVIVAFTQCYAGAAAALRAETESLTSITGAHVDEAEFNARYAGMPMVMGLNIGARIPLYGLAGQWRDVLRLADDPAIAASPPFIPHVPIAFWSGVAALRLLAEAGSGNEALALRARANEAVQFLNNVRDAASSDSVRHRLAFLTAEVARAEGRHSHVESLYKSAVEAARVASFRIEHAFFEEVLGNWLADHAHNADAAGAALRDAQQGYARAEAYRLVDRVQRRLLEIDTHNASLDNVAGLDRVDTLAILQAVQVLNRHLDLKPLLERLLTIILEFTGAERGMIVCVADTVPRIEWSIGADPGAGLPVTLIRFVANSGEATMLDNPALITQSRAVSNFSDDPYFQAARPLSVMCRPIDRLTPVRRVLYLEHRSMANVFGAKRQQVLSLLCSQASVLIDNAEHYSRLGEMVRARTHELERANTELHEQQVELERARDAAQAAAHAKAQFLANMSHEIRTPLNTVMGMTSLALGFEQAPKVRRLLGKAHFAAEHLLSIIDDILDFSRIDSGHFTPLKESFSLEAAFHELIALVGFKAFDKGLELIYDIDPEVPDTLIGDQLRLKQILINLISNAVKFTDRGCIRVAVRLAKTGAQSATLKFEVADTGIGIALADQARLFHHFGQIDSSVGRRHGGTGLGLAICKGLVEAMNGSVGVISTPGNGATFHCSIVFELPPDRVPADKLPFELAGYHVLVAEPDDITRAHNVALMESLGLIATGVRDYPDATAAVKRAEDRGCPFDVVVVNAELAGYKSLQRELETRPVMPLVVTERRPSSLESAIGTGNGDAAGARLQVTLPLLRGILKDILQREFEQDVQAVKADGLADLAGTLQLAHNRILVVDDSALNREVLVELLSIFGVQTVEVENGREALDALERSASYDCVIIDNHMPVMDGLTASRIIREQSSLDHIAIVVLTGDIFMPSSAETANAAADGFLFKPFNIDQLVQVIKSARAARDAPPP